MVKLLETDVLRQYRQLVREQVLLPLNSAALCGDDNFVLVHCGDGHKAPRFIEDLRAVTVCPHAVSVNGGALWLDPKFRDPLFSVREHQTIRDFLVYQKLESMVLKGTNRGGVAVHLDCGKAARHDVQLIRLLEVAVRAKCFAKRRVPQLVTRLQRLGTFSAEEVAFLEGIKIASLVHVHDGSEFFIKYINEDHPRFRHLRQAV